MEKEKERSSTEYECECCGAVVDVHDYPLVSSSGQQVCEDCYWGDEDDA